MNIFWDYVEGAGGEVGFEVCLIIVNKVEGYMGSERWWDWAVALASDGRAARQGENWREDQAGITH